MRVLVTAFDPFGGLDTNSSLMVLERLGKEIGDIFVEKLVVPTVYGECAEISWNRAKEINADAILSLGQAGGRKCVTVETIAINYACSKTKDNKDTLIYGEKLVDDGENALFSTLDVKKMVKAAQGLGIEAELSVSAGGFVCNSLLYNLLDKAKRENRDIPIGFVHLPYEESQKQDGFSMKCEDMCRLVEEMIKNIYI